jgi:ABC-2 type transport system ATP-binding protein
MAVIEVVQAHKSYRRARKPPTMAVDGLDLLVEKGGVHGFLGAERVGQDHDDPDAARARTT